MRIPVFIQLKTLIYLLVVALNFIPGILQAQFTDRYWTFGEHAAINFSNVLNPVAETSRINARLDRLTKGIYIIILETEK